MTHAHQVGGVWEIPRAPPRLAAYAASTLSSVIGRSRTRTPVA
jgi:hypothetical protein